MTVFVDTNILIDLVCERESFVQSARLLFAYGFSKVSSHFGPYSQVFIKAIALLRN